VQGESRAIDPGALVEVVVHADLDDVGRGHFGIEQLMPLDQEVPRVGWHTHGGMVEDHVAPAMQRQQPVNCGEVEPGQAVGVG